MKTPDVSSFKTYTSDSPLKRPGVFFRNMFLDLAQSRELGWRLAIRDISSQYRQAALGFLWAFIIPLLNTLIWIFLQGSGIVQMKDTFLPYPVYVLSGTILWAIFSEAFNAPLKVTTGAKQMLSKINFPRESLIISGLLQTLFNAVIKLIILFAVLLLMGFVPTWYIFLFPLGLISLILAGTALGLLFTPLGLLYSDVGKVIPIMMQFLMYLSPIVFPLPEQGLPAKIIRMNPLTPLIISTRNWLTGFQGLNSELFHVTIGFSLLLFLAWMVYKLAIPILVERMNT